jgi:hypothetical protein
MQIGSVGPVGDRTYNPSLTPRSCASSSAAATGLRYFALDGTDHDSHRAQASMIRRYIAWRNHHATDPVLRKIIRRAETTKRAKVA